jgi:hypothetical protein
MKLSQMAPLAIIAVAALSSCGDDEVGVRDASTSMLADSTVLEAMRSVDTVGRILYEPAADLSLTSAQQRRPDIFRPPSPPATRPAAPKDTTTAKDASRRAPP